MNNPFFADLAKISNMDMNALERADELERFLKSDICKEQEAINKEFLNRKYDITKPIEYLPVIKVECRSRQHINQNKKAFFPK